MDVILVPFSENVFLIGEGVIGVGVDEGKNWIRLF